MKKLLAAILAMAVLLGMMTVPAFAEETEDVWDGAAVSTDWYGEGTAEEFVINTAADLAGLAKLVNDGTNFLKKTVRLGANINLNDEEWTPIGKSGKTFQGTFDGDGHTIKNLKITSGAHDVGLFGMTASGAVKNFTLENASVKGNQETGAVAGSPFTSAYSDITVKGLIQVDGYAYVGGAFGKNAYEDITNVDVIGDPESYVNAESETYRTYVGGLVGFMGEGNITVADCDVQIDVIGSTCDIGGILGNLHYGNKMTNCTYSGSLKLTTPTEEKDRSEIGGLVGTVLTNPAYTTSISGSTANVESAEVTAMDGTVEDVTDTITAAGAFYSGMAESQNGAYAFDATVNDRPESSTNIVARIGDKTYLTLADAVAAADVADEIIVDADVTEEKITLNKPVTIKGTENARVSFISILADDVTLDSLTFAESETVTNQYYSVVVGNASTGVNNTTIKNCVFTKPANFVNGKNPQAINISTHNHTNTLIENNTFNNQYETAVYCRGGNGVTLKDNTVETKGFGFRFLGTSGANVTGNRFNISNKGFDHAAMEFRLYNDNTGSPCADFTVEKNIFEGSSNLDFYKSVAAFGEEKLDMSDNYWGGGMPSTSQIPGTEAKYITVASYYTALDESTGLPAEDSLVTIVEEQEEVTKQIELKAVEGTNQVNVYITGSLADGTAAYVKNLIAAHLNLTTSKGFSITGVEAVDPYWCVDVVGENDYLVRAQGRNPIIPGLPVPEPELLSGDKIHIATVTIGGYGIGTLTAGGGQDTDNDVEQQTDVDHIVLSSNLDQTVLEFNISPATQNLTVKVAFPNEIADNAADYQDMTVSISGGHLAEAITVELGDGEEEFAFDTVELGGKTYNAYTVEVADTLLQNTAYTVTIEGAGYRTARYTVNMQEADKDLTFWNNVMDTATVIETNNDSDSAKARVTFLAGDIVKDNNINIYDLSAVVSYFGEDNLVEENPGYAKYDLNRDGKIDSKDVAMVLVSWGN